MTVGREGERAARRYLEARGLTFRAANIRAPFGEIDLVMEDPTTRELVFVEVKTRRGTAFGTPEESVTQEKREKLSKLVAWYCARIGWSGQVRLDVVGVLVRPGGEPTVTHTRWVGEARS